MNRLDGPLDAALHLLDRQVIDDEGLMVCKVDDLEVVDQGSSLVVTGLLVGTPVWTGRLGGWVHERWRRLGSAQSDRRLPYRIGLDEVEELTAEVHLRGGRDGVLRRQEHGDDPAHHRMQDLLQAGVVGSGGKALGHVLDVRLSPGDTIGLKVEAVVVGRGRPGSYLGYDRSADQGPWLVNRIVRRLHRHSGLVLMAEVVAIDWARAEVRCQDGLRRLTLAGDTDST